MFFIFGQPGTLDTGRQAELRLLVLAALADGIGAVIHVATSFSTFVGNGTLRTRWIWWYALRIVIGISLGLLVVFFLRAGLITGASVDGVNEFGVVAIGALVGMFSKQFVDKLSQVFDTLFGTQGDQGRDDKPIPEDGTQPVNPKPVLSPVATAVSRSVGALTLAGQGFVRGMSVFVNDIEAEQKNLTGTSVDITVPRQILDDLGLKSLSIVAENSGPGGGRSEPIEVGLDS